jgi:hypothetical protein
MNENKKALLLIAKMKRDALAAQKLQNSAVSHVAEAVVAKAERGERGVDGLTGDVGAIGASGVDGRDGSDGKDAVAVTDVDFDFDNRLLMTMEDGTVHVSESAVNILRGQTGATGPRGEKGDSGTGGTGDDFNLDGGRADSVYTAAQLIQGGGA